VPKSPRQISKEALLRYAKTPPPPEEPIPPRALDAWQEGFSRGAAEEFIQEYCSMPSRPEIDPTMPSGSIVDMSNEDIGTLHAQFVSWVEFLEPQLALAEISAAEVEALKEHIQAEVRLRKAGTVADKNAKAINDQAFIEVEMKALTATAKAKLLKARLRGYDRCATALSREMTRRQAINDTVG
jgi:hypothetical protein